MREFRLLFAAVLALTFGLGSDCSSTDDTPGAAACHNPPQVADVACRACLASHCADETAAEYGARWAEGVYTGGVCEAVLTCVCSCPQYDDACGNACVARSTLDCQTADAKVRSCSQNARCSCVF